MTTKGSVSGTLAGLMVLGGALSLAGTSKPAYNRHQEAYYLVLSVDQGGFKRVSYGELPYLMLQAIRELKAGNDQLKAENDDLRDRIQRLEEIANH
jgi:hypothetical protein